MFACLDIETTGLNPNEDHIIEVAIVIFDNNKIIKEWSSFVACPIRLPEFTKRLTGITDEMLVGAPTLAEIESEIREIVGDFPIMGHFIFFDLNFLASKKISLPNLQLDTCQLAQTFLLTEKSYSLEVLVQKLGIKHENAHRALDDVKANIELFYRLKNHILSMDANKTITAKKILEKSTWPWAPYISEILAEDLPGEKIEDDVKRDIQIKSGKRANLFEFSKDLGHNFLLQEASHSNTDILDFAEELEGNVLLVVPDIEKFPSENNSAKLKDADQYLDKKKFENFIKKSSLDSIETMLSLKISFWETFTGDKSEIKLFKEENSIWNEIACDENVDLGHLEGNENYYEKAILDSRSKKITIVDQRHFLRDKLRVEPNLASAKNTIIANAEELMENSEKAWKISLSEKKLTEDIERIKSENPDNELTLENLKNKVSILFGLLGIFTEKNSEEREKTIILEKFHKNTSEWTKILNASEALEQAITEFFPKLNNSPSLKILEKLLIFFCKIMKNEGMVTWINLDRNDQPIVFSFPHSPQKVFADKIWQGTQNLIFLCHKGNLNDDFAYLKKELGIPEQIKFHYHESINPLPIEMIKISSVNNEKNIAETCSEISKCLSEQEGDFFLLINSMASAEQFFYKMEKVARETNRKLLVQNMGGSLGKILKKAGENPQRNIFVGNTFMLFYLLDEGLSPSTLGIHRLPFAYPGDPIQIEKSKLFENIFKEFVLPQAALKFQKILYAFLNEDWKDKKILLLDRRIEEYGTLFLA